MASPSSTKIVEVAHVAPFTASTESTTHYSLPLTFFDTLCFKFRASEFLFFYSLSETKDTFYNSVLPKLKHSLSFTLQYFLPLAGKLTWPQDSPKPVVLYTPGDVVSVSVAESDSDFDLFTAKDAFQISAVRPLISPLHVSETGASIVAIQITVFPNSGFSIGLTAHHAILDGKSAAMFMKSWAYLSRENPPLLPEFTPFYDRTVIKDLSGFAVKMLNYWMGNPGSTLSECRNDPKLFEFHQFQGVDEPSDLYQATFELSRADIDKLRQRVSTNWNSSTRISSFVLTYAYVVVCFLKATEEDDSKRKCILGIAADYRSRMTPPLPENYFGSCIVFKRTTDDLREHSLGRKEDLLTAIAVEISGLVNKLGEHKDCFKEVEEFFATPHLMSYENCHLIRVGGSPKFGVYSTDFGWGRPKKVSMASLEDGSISMAETRDGDGGIEVDLVLKKHQMDIFASMFAAGLGEG